MKENIIFLGNGAAFATHSPNTSAIINNHILYDAGEDVYKLLIKHEYINAIDTILITHLHSDHAGSLPTIIFHLAKLYDIKPTIVSGKDIKLQEYLDLTGVDRNYYTLADSLSWAKPIKTKHSDKFAAYGFLIQFKNERIYLSGDTSQLPIKILEEFYNKSIQKIYVDTTCYKNTSHQHIDRLCKQIKKEDRDRVYCIHLDNKKLKAKVLDEGFQLPKTLE